MDSVGSRVSVGDSGVKVNVTVAGLFNTASVCRATIVWAMDVLTALGSGVGAVRPGCTQASETINNITNDKKAGWFLNMFLLLVTPLS
jgi:hypothetical protein